MRLIQLMHPDHQINTKDIGRKVLVNAEICNEVAEKQHGSRKHHQAGLLLLNKVLVRDIFVLIVSQAVMQRMMLRDVMIQLIIILLFLP